MAARRGYQMWRCAGVAAPPRASALLVFLLLLAPTFTPAATPWPKADQDRVRKVCGSAKGADDGLCACALSALMTRWPDSTEFWRALETQDGKLEFFFWARECRVVQDIKAVVEERLSAALGKGWSSVRVADRAALGEAGYRVDSAFVRGGSGRVGGAPVIVTVRVAPEVVGRASFAQSMSDADLRELCGKGPGRSETVARVEEVRFDSAQMTYWCEWAADDPQSGRVRSVYVWQFHRSHLVVLDAMIRPDAAPLGSSEVRRAFRQVIAQLAASETPNEVTSGPAER